MILARTLRRTFVLHGALPEPYLAFLHTVPSASSETVYTSDIEIAAGRDGLFSMACGWGRQITGSARALAVTLDRDILRLASQDEGSAPQLPACILSVRGVRTMVVGGAGINLDGLVVALLLRGAAFEGAGLVFFRAEGACAHLMKPRLHARQLAACGLPISQLEPPMLIFHHDQPRWAIDPSAAGAQWVNGVGPVRVVAFVEHNEGGRAAVVPARPAEARARLMRDVMYPQKPFMQDLVRLAGFLSDAMVLRLVTGDTATAAALLNAAIARNEH